MKYYAALDASMEQSNLCVVDDQGSVVREAKVGTDPGVIARCLAAYGLVYEAVGLEAGPMSQWLYAGLAAAGLPVVCLETRQAKAALSAMRNKTDRNDARGLAQLLRTGWFRAVHVKSVGAQQGRALLRARQLLLGKLVDLENGIRGILCNFGLRLGAVGHGRFAQRARAVTEGSPVAGCVGALLEAHAALLASFARLHGEAVELARQDEVCRRLATVPGVGSLTALAFRLTIDDPERFSRSRAVGAHLGLTPRRYQSGETDRQGRISKCGDGLLRALLFEAATVLLTRVKRWSSLKVWAVRIAKRSGARRARVALARKLAVVMHRMWLDGSVFRWGKAEPAAA